MIRASVDLGTNTCLLLIVDSKDGDKVIGDYSTVVRLGQSVDVEKKLHPDAKQRALACLNDYAQKIREAGGNPKQAVCVATSQARDASNADEFFGRVEEETGFRFRVLSGDDEARLTFKGALLPGMDPARAAVIDIGGGSTEYTTLSGGQSLDIGSVRFTERFLKSDPVTDEQFWAAQDAVDEALQALEPLRKSLPADCQWVAVAGTAVNLACWHAGIAEFDRDAIDRLVVSKGDVHRMVEELKWRTVEERSALTGIEKGRADVILAGSLILWRSMELLGIKDLRISSRGLRYGALAELS